MFWMVREQVVREAKIEELREGGGFIKVNSLVHNVVRRAGSTVNGHHLEGIAKLTDGSFLRRGTPRSHGIGWCAKQRDQTRIGIKTQTRE